jgi:hypothetical protein
VVVAAVEVTATTMMNGLLKNVTVLSHLLLGFHTMNDECVICLAHITGDTGVAILECRHTFHLQCVFTWFQEQEGNASCPCCRRAAFYDLPVEEDDNDNYSDNEEDGDTVSIYSSEGEEENNSVNVDQFSGVHLQITVGPEGRSVLGLTG